MEELFEKMLNFMGNQCADQNTTEKKKMRLEFWAKCYSIKQPLLGT